MSRRPLAERSSSAHPNRSKGWEARFERYLNELGRERVEAILRAKGDLPARPKRKDKIPELDLHEFTLEEATHLVRLFVEGVRERRERVARIISGNGKHSPGGIPVLQPAVQRQLIRMKKRRILIGFRLENGDGSFLIFPSQMRRKC